MIADPLYLFRGFDLRHDNRIRIRRQRRGEIIFLDSRANTVDADTLLGFAKIQFFHRLCNDRPRFGFLVCCHAIFHIHANGINP